MAAHTHYVKITMEVGNVEDDEPHQEVIVNQRTESSVENTALQQAVTGAITSMFIDLGNDAMSEKSGNARQNR